MRSFEETAIAFDRAAGAAGVSYAFVGGMAVNAWGIPRNTADLDVLVDLRPDRVAAFVEHLRSGGYSVGEGDLRDAFRDGSHVTVFDDRGAIHLDLRLCRRSEERDEVAAAIRLDLAGAAIRVARPEDTVAFKLSFGSPQDLADARGILHRQRPRIDLARLVALAERLGVEGNLRQLLEEAGDGPA